MFAMLTASLPFTTESTDIADLYQKIVNFQINPVPDSLSEGTAYSISKYLSISDHVYKVNIIYNSKVSYNYKGNKKNRLNLKT